MRTEAWAGLLLLAVALAGCIGGEDASSGDELDPSVAEAADGRLGPDGDTSHPEPQPVERRFVWDGNVGTGLAVCDLPSTSCGWLYLGLDAYYQRQTHGVPQVIELTATWDPVTPATEEISVRLDMNVPDPETGTRDEVTIASAAGPSPLTLTVKVPDDARHRFELILRPGPMPVPSVRATVDQPVHVEGTVTALMEGSP